MHLHSTSMVSAYFGDVPIAEEPLNATAQAAAQRSRYKDVVKCHVYINRGDSRIIGSSGSCNKLQELLDRGTINYKTSDDELIWLNAYLHSSSSNISTDSSVNSVMCSNDNNSRNYSNSRHANSHNVSQPETSALESIEKLREELQTEAETRKEIADNLDVALQCSGSPEGVGSDEENRGGYIRKANTLRTLTGTSLDECEKLLEYHNGDLEKACLSFFDKVDDSNASAKITFTLPNGTRIAEHVALSKTIWDLKVVVYNHLPDKDRGFGMYSDEKPLTDMDYNKTLRQSGILNSASVEITVKYL